MRQQLPDNIFMAEHTSTNAHPPSSENRAPGGENTAASHIGETGSKRAEPVSATAPAEGLAAATAAAPEFDGISTTQFQTRMRRAPAWFCSFLASNQREKHRLRDGLRIIRATSPLLMKRRNGYLLSADERQQVKTMLRSASSVSPYLFIWAVPGSMLLLPFLAWYLDKRRKNRSSYKT